ncbi:MAG: NAD-dependent epimerase/dehydratase family protein [Magnetospirillum sp.]|jgi:D-erythronate 2-dehydrogenase|nr:NAD-dependent epimerase/dehydratase family protein [Magnetospirillum sp.]
MRVVITGGTGMLGKKLAGELLKRGTLVDRSGKPREISKIVLFDIAEAPGIPADPRIDVQLGDVDDPATIDRLIAPDTGAIFHLAGVVSSGAERDFDLGYRVNLDGTREVLEAARRLKQPIKLVFASSLACYGGGLPPVIPDDFRITPQTSYGTQKAIGELLVADYARKGYVDGRSLRLPTIVVRPGKPNLAASTFASSILREPLAGERAVCPVDPETWMPLLSPRRCIDAFIRAHDLADADWGWNRTLLLPSLDITVREMAEGLRRAAGEAAYALIDWKHDPAIAKIVAGWPARMAAKRAVAMGFAADASIDEMIENYRRDDAPAARA